MGCEPFHMGLCLWESACYRIPQSKIKDFCQLPLAREPLRAVPADNAHGILLRIVTAPPVPGIGGLSAELIHYSLFTIH